MIMTEERKGIYQLIPIPLGRTYTEHEIVIGGDLLVTAQIPISVMARLNDKSSRQLDLAVFRRIKMKVDRIFITTTVTSTTDLLLFTSKGIEVDVLGFGERVTLVDTVGVDYDARDTVAVLADSTITLLADGATYTGAQFATEGYNKITGSVFSNATGTLYVDQSQNGVNYDIVDTIAYVGAALTGGFSVEIVAPYARIRFTDTVVTAQTSFRLFAYLSTGA